MEASAHWEVWGGQCGSPPEGLTQDLHRQAGLLQSPSSIILLLSSCSLMQLLWKGLVKSMLQLPKSANYTCWCQIFLSEYQNVALDHQEYETFCWLTRNFLKLSNWHFPWIAKIPFAGKSGLISCFLLGNPPVEFLFSHFHKEGACSPPTIFLHHSFP